MSNLTSRKIYSRITSVFILLTTIALILIFHVTLATATIHMKAQTENFVFDGPIDISDMDLSQAASVELEGQSEFPVSGKITKSDKAGVSVTVRNTTNRAQPLVTTTRFLTPEGLLFRLQQNITVPANGSVEAFIVADQVGDAYLIPAGRFTIPGLATSLQSQIYGESSETASFDRIESNVISEDDIERATGDLIEKMMPSALAELKKSVEIDNKDNVVAQAIEAKSDIEIGQRAEKFLLTAKIKFSYLSIARPELLQRAGEALRRKLPDSMSVNAINEDSFGYRLNQNNDTVTVDGHLEATISKSTDWSTSVNLNELHGLSAYEAEKKLQQAGLPVTRVSLWPFWVQKVPKLNDHIRIVTEN